MGKKLTTSEFITKAKDVHGSKYDYSEVVYIGSKEKVKIICPEHGAFYQKPNGHLCGEGCRECGNIYKVNTGKATSKEDFIAKAKEVHPNLYEYDDIIFVNMVSKVSVKCEEHGYFEVIPSKHIGIRKTGCPHCFKEKGNLKGRNTLDYFLKKALEVHGDKYDYSKVEYSTSKTKIEIICKTHGVFLQAPSKHTMGRGCPKCREDAFDLSYIERYKGTPVSFYVIQIDHLFKIGITVQKSVIERYRYEIEDLNRIKPLTFITFEDVEDAYNLEQSLIEKYKHLRYSGKYIFRQTRNNEIFTENIYEKYLEELNNGK